MRNSTIIKILFILSMGWAATTKANDGFDYRYPMTQTYEGNPLFVNFPSPMFGDEGGSPGIMYTADPTARVWNINGEEVLYVYCSHDMEPAVGCDRMDRYHVYSTKDMRSWTDHGEILKAEDVNEQFGFTCPGFMWAPDCVYNPNDHLYYYYFPHPTDGNDWGGTFRIFVATSSNPATGFTVKKVIEGLPPRIDPNVFVDDDGQPYIYVGGGAHVYGCKLKKDDWTTLDGTPKEMSGMEDFHEGAWVFKHDGRYYLSYPDNFSPNQGGNRMRWATSNSPLGPWKDGGVYMNPHGEETAHGSVVKFKGQYYQFYHTGNYSGNGTLRTVCVDPLTIRADGSIDLIRNWGTPYGGVLPSVKPNYRTVLEAEHYNLGGSHYGYFMRPVKYADGTTFVPEPTVENRGNITCISKMTRKEWTRYSINVTKTSNYVIRVIAARENEGDCGFWLLVDGVVVNSHPEKYSERAIKTAVGQFDEISFSNVHLTEGEHFIEFRPMTGVISLDRIEVGKADAPVFINEVVQSRPADGKYYTLSEVCRKDVPHGILICNGKKILK
ncbi:MAG: family 43 glycosylhydrolase [Prevotella sp.]|nr:family 43 glycosylhydrolase [Prevotella sp.]